MQALGQFRGSIMQVPPMVSALKKDGQRLYDLARRGIEVERQARKVEIYMLELVGNHEIMVKCSAGTYIRSLIDDLGRVLGCGACMTSLRRTQANGYDIARCKPLEEIGPADVLPIDSALAAYPAVTVTPAQALRFRNGGALDLVRLHGLGTGELHRIYSDKIFLGLGQVQGEQLAVARLLAEEGAS